MSWFGTVETPQPSCPEEKAWLMVKRWNGGWYTVICFRRFEGDIDHAEGRSATKSSLNQA